ncbi:type I methionyl aminopeptidase [Fusibacter tunisiensis]|jgi:methionyl aminopeptidase|uniref:Methionine aminopeptidase n=1 Tax=Fusibacter tunisiensis TaxID=1008308 RepID=A0ABS2MQY0_9FIRM|nr:type I methionyl aminopeptidase [Fusibacter tunisiensis]MBM7561817.1 methionyl aminopeptidase [Fusibacter tunisiensis]
MIVIKSNKEIELMQESGRIVALVHETVKKAIKPGITTGELDAIAEAVIRENGAIPSFKGYGGFPGSICASINDQVIHGIPGETILREGDIISIDVGALKNGYHGDAARTHPVGQVSEAAAELIKVTEESFFEGLKYCRKGYRLSDISNAIQTYSEDRGYGVVRDFVGHGVGRELHEDPPIPNYGPAGRGPRLVPGMVLAIEPMINQGDWKVKVLDDEWTVVTLDGLLSAHYEHTVVITDEDPILLTNSKNEVF